MNEQDIRDFIDICDVLREQDIIDENGQGSFTREQFNEAWEIVKKRRSAI